MAGELRERVEVWVDIGRSYIGGVPAVVLVVLACLCVYMCVARKLVMIWVAGDSAGPEGRVATL